MGVPGSNWTQKCQIRGWGVHDMWKEGGSLEIIAFPLTVGWIGLFLWIKCELCESSAWNCLVLSNTVLANEGTSEERDWEGHHQMSKVLGRNLRRASRANTFNLAGKSAYKESLAMGRFVKEAPSVPWRIQCEMSHFFGGVRQRLQRVSKTIHAP